MTIFFDHLLVSLPSRLLSTLDPPPSQTLRLSLPTFSRQSLSPWTYHGQQPHTKLGSNPNVISPSALFPLMKPWWRNVWQSSSLILSSKSAFVIFCSLLLSQIKKSCGFFRLGSTLKTYVRHRKTHSLKPLGISLERFLVLLGKVQEKYLHQKTYIKKSNERLHKIHNKWRVVKD